MVARHRRLLAALLAAAAVFLATTAMHRAPAGTVPVVVASTRIPGGSAVTSSQVRVVDMPLDLAPDGARSRPEEVVGRTVVADLPKGAAVTDASFLTAAAGSKGQALVGVHLSDPALLSMLRVGQKVSVVSGESGAAKVIAADAVIRALPHPSGGGLLGDNGTGLVVVATDERSAAEIAVQSSNSTIGLVVR
ncbi:SAF domain-containing protein [Acidipropionibacterium timonense]|uniref:SAF domain-containing protein n=1 Tax=Acidipropionibacterium timonense TaxID=2161818 RepID=UPI001436B85D|nr:SAF domain-containing protein [Acidipropionibacterium timonense]